MAGGVVLVIAGVWLLLQTLAGDLPRRVLSWGNSALFSGPTVPSTPAGKGESGFDPESGQSGGGAGGGGGGSW